MKTAVIAIIFFSLSAQCSLFAVSKHYNINRPTNTKDIQYAHDKLAILEDLVWVVLYSLSGGYSAAHGNISGAIMGTGNGVKKFLNVLEIYQENLRFERELEEKSYNTHQSIERGLFMFEKFMFISIVVYFFINYLFVLKRKMQTKKLLSSRLEQLS